MTRPIRLALLVLLLLLALIAAAIPALAPAAAASTPAPHWRPDGLTIRGAYHVHSVASDGTGTLDDIAAAAARAGLQFVIPLVLFFAVRYYRQRQGLPIDAAFKEIPPE